MGLDAQIISHRKRGFGLIVFAEHCVSFHHRLAFGNGIFLALCSGSVQRRVLSGGANGTSWSELSSEAYDNLFFANGYFYAHVFGGVPPIGNARPTEVGG